VASWTKQTFGFADNFDVLADCDATDDLAPQDPAAAATVQLLANSCRPGANACLVCLEDIKHAEAVSGKPGTPCCELLVSFVSFGSLFYLCHLCHFSLACCSCFGWLRTFRHRMVKFATCTHALPLAAHRLCRGGKQQSGGGLLPPCCSDQTVHAVSCTRRHTSAEDGRHTTSHPVRGTYGVACCVLLASFRACV
jgi:hypothetical protein